MGNNGSLQFNFYTADKRKLYNLICRYINIEDLYFSNEKKHISGNVINNLHMTIYYGRSLSRLKLDISNLMKVDSITLGEVKLVEGFNSQYYVLITDVILSEVQKEIISDYLLKIAPQAKYNLKYHVTLAYLKHPLNDLYKIQKIFKDKRIVLKTKSVSFEL